MSGEGGGNDFGGRRKHLGQLALVFKHRHGSWADFGQFLKAIFGDLPSSSQIATISQTRRIICRHNAGGRNYDALVAAAHGPVLQRPVFNHERYTRPCVTIGSFEEKKNPGLVVADLCNKANRFLQSIGKGDPEASTGRDFEYDEKDRSVSPLSDESGGDPESQGAIDASNILETPRQRNVARFPPLPAREDSFDTDDFFGDVDTLNQLEGILAEFDRPQTPSSVSTPTGYAQSEDSLIQLTMRSSTKIRAATLGYLWQFADDPVRLRERFRLLCSDPRLHVLHLCGCGVSFVDPVTRQRRHGCVEKTHLKLGSAADNMLHKSYHVTIHHANPLDYEAFCGICHRAEGGDGIF